MVRLIVTLLVAVFVHQLISDVKSLFAEEYSNADTLARPNILFVYTDDQAPWGFASSGYKQAYTPNMDRLARDGAMFTNSFVPTPVCSPARASFLTSRYASEYGILDFIPHPQHKLYDSNDGIGLDPDSVTFAEVLQKSGYATGLVGKFHLGDWTQTDNKIYHPTNHGYDYFMGLTGGGTTPVDPPLEKNGSVRQFEGLTTDILTEDALKFIRDHQEKPFLLSLHYRAPHSKWLPVAEEDWAPYVNLDPDIPNPDYPGLQTELVKKKTREYLASISGVDRNLGRVLALLEELKIADSTVVIFTSDHGYNMGHNGITHKGNGSWIVDPDPPATKYVRAGHRPNMYDNSLKVPTIVRWPGKVKPGIVIDETITSLDWYPTLVEIAGAILPANHLVRGRSLIPLLVGDTPADWDQDYYGEYSQIHYSQAYMRCYRTPEWKLIRDFLDSGRNELYHLSLDPEEANNLINDKRPEVQSVIAELSQKIDARMIEVGDDLLKESVSTSK
ncbi:Choline-sulfatase [Polystyrenella longa]|uniref:Choline-sulfatase n=1 Tax=Polystyrenella longa TaxID=2528007 RepID=A0A518CMU5_9PLAN|nr:sulfatase-like hydrolase/transferase [Polystyrenella longa]QDU80533.1 Choline-sulfatase [Polystyrenella longa]